MRRSIKLAITAVAATAGVSATLAATSVAPASAAEAPCPQLYVCLYDNANYTGLLWKGIFTLNLPASADNRTSSVVNNSGASAWLFKNPNHGDVMAPIEIGIGKRQALTGSWDNAISSLYCY
jgi:hypothetical protein